MVGVRKRMVVFALRRSKSCLFVDECALAELTQFSCHSRSHSHSHSHSSHSVVSIAKINTHEPSIPIPFPT